MTAIVSEAASDNAHDAGWRTVLLARARACGARDLTEWSRSLPLATFEELAARLGGGIALIRLEQLMREEAERSRTLDHFARDCFVRQIRKRLPQGWGVGANHGFREAHAYASWAAALGEGFDTAKARLRDALKAEGVVPRGWMPNGPADPVITLLFSELSFDPP